MVFVFINTDKVKTKSIRHFRKTYLSVSGRSEKKYKSVLSPEDTAVAKDMLSGRGEWFCQAIETVNHGRRETELIFYELVTSFPIVTKPKRGQDYDQSGMMYSGGVRSFNISDIEVGRGRMVYFFDLCRWHDDLVQYVTSRPYRYR